jgi:hypothetical protein
VEKFKYLGTTPTNQNSVQEEMKGGLKSGNACCSLVQNVLSSKHIKITIYRTTILPVVLYGCETWSFTLREERRVRVLENRVLRIFGTKRGEETGEWRKLHKEEINDLYSSPNIFRVINREEMGGSCSTYGGEEKCI